MGRNTGLAIGAGIARGIEKAANNIVNLQMAKEELSQKKSAFDLDMKIKKLQLQQAETKSDPELIASQVDYLKKQQKAANAILDIQNARIDAIQKGEKSKVDELTKQYNMISTALEGYSLGSAKVKEYNADEQVKLKVKDNGVESLTPGEKALWERLNRSGQAGYNPMNDINSLSNSSGGGKDTSVMSSSGGGGKQSSDNWWNQ